MIDWTLSVGSQSRSCASPRGPVPPFSHARGFTMIEVMMSVVLMAIGLALALPSYREMVEKRQVTNGAEQLSAFVNTAQGLAQKRNRPVTVSYIPTSETDWCLGMAEDDTVCHCKNAPETCTVDGQTHVLNMSHANGHALMAAVSSASHAYYINPERGLFLPCEGEGMEWQPICTPIPIADQSTTLSARNQPLDIELRSASGDFALRMQVNNTGRVSLCNSAGAREAIPGYNCSQEEAGL